MKKIEPKNNRDSFNELNELLAKEISEVNELILQYAQNHVDLIPEITSYITQSGGKRLRPLLTLACAKIFQDKVGGSVIKLSAAVEFIHTATLLHDDVVDGSEKRRGKPTANRVWDNKSCILVGDFLFSQAFKLMVATKNIRALDLLSNASAVIAESEVWQLSILDDPKLSLDEYIKLITGKTAILFASACASGGIESGCTKEQEESLDSYGLNLGISFQIIDDILDYVGSAKTGKKIGNDFLEGKITLPVIYSYLNADAVGRDSIIKLFNLENREDHSNFEALGRLLDQYDGIKDAKNLAKEYATKAINDLEKIPSCHVRNLLIDYTLEMLGRLN
jgi:octaprenyl-diphosphate synthase